MEKEFKKGDIVNYAGRNRIIVDVEDKRYVLKDHVDDRPFRVPKKSMLLKPAIEKTSFRKNKKRKFSKVI